MVHNSQPGRMKVHLSIYRRMLLPFKLWLNEAENDIIDAAVFFARTGRLTARMIGGFTFCCYLIFKHSLTYKKKEYFVICAAWPEVMLQWRTEQNNFVRPQAVQAPVVRWSSCEIRVMAKLKEFVLEYLRSLLDLLGIKKINTIKFSIKIPHLTSIVHRLLSDRLLR